jgi:hypothetical protein
MCFILVLVITTLACGTLFFMFDGHRFESTIECLYFFSLDSFPFIIQIRQLYSMMGPELPLLLNYS